MTDAKTPAADLQDATPAGFDLPSITMDKRVDLALTAAVMALGAFAIWKATSFRIGNYPDPLTSRGMPYILGGFMIIGGAILGLRRLKGWRELPGHLVVAEGSEDEAGHPASSLRAVAVMLCGFFWAAMLMPLGYLVVTPLALMAMLLAMGARSHLQLGLFPIGFTLVTWTIFSQVLNVLLPLGPLAPLARQWGLAY